MMAALENSKLKIFRNNTTYGYLSTIYYAII
jgi:hypothetical protein